QRLVRAENPLINGSRVYSTYQNVTQAATQTITATNLIVEQGTHFRMFAGQEIDLQPGVDFQYGSDVDVRIDDCTNANYSLRMSNPNPLSQKEIDAIWHELKKELYGYQPESEKEIRHLTVYLNPTSNFITIIYTQFLSFPSIITFYDINGRLLKTNNHHTQNEGKQQIRLDVTALKESTYFYTLQVGELTYNGKIVKINP